MIRDIRYGKPQTIEGWTVVVQRHDLELVTALTGEGSGPVFYTSRERARGFARQLREHNIRASVRRICMTCTIEK